MAKEKAKVAAQEKMTPNFDLDKQSSDDEFKVGLVGDEKVKSAKRRDSVKVKVTEEEEEEGEEGEEGDWEEYDADQYDVKVKFKLVLSYTENKC